MKTTEKSIATVTLHGAGEWHEYKRQEIAAWLCDQASALENEGVNYSKRFTARYIVPE